MNDRVEKIKEFLKQTPDDCFLNHALALEYVKVGDDVEAARLFQKNLDFDADYIGTYYHYAKLLERMEDEDKAINIYELGMKSCKKAGDMHSLSELRSAYEELTF